MDKKFSDRLTEFLDSECGDFSMSYTWEWNENTACCEVTVQNDYNTDLNKTVNFKYDKEKDDLKIELSEDSFYATREFDHSVKYFWMLISPSLFPNN